MEYYIFQESSKWHEFRIKRVTAFVRFSAMLLIIGGSLWATVFAVQRLYLIFAMALGLVLLACYSLYLIKHGKGNYSKHIIFLSVTAYFLFASTFLDGPDDINKAQGTVHFWFIVLAIFFYYLYYDLSPLKRDLVSALLLAFFFLFHFDYISFSPIVHVENRDVINQITMLTVLICTLFLTRQFAVQITKAEIAITQSADRMQGLLENILPKSVADRLTKEKTSFADSFTECSVLFADISGFTSWSENHDPTEVANRLNEIFTKFDEAVDRANLTKIKTNGDSYMVVAGLPELRNDHAYALILLAMEFHVIAEQDTNFKFRIGINSGSVAAGVIGKKRFIYDLWGDTVNTASRMESSGEIGKVNISGATYEIVKDKFNCEYRGKVKAKHKGEIDMYFVNV
jgi:class 3 adenylate cyclase